MTEVGDVCCEILRGCPLPSKVGQFHTTRVTEQGRADELYRCPEMDHNQK
jgi:hypothetical protein